MRASFFTISATLCCAALFGQATPEVTVSGTVENSATGAGIAGAQVVVVGPPTSIRLITDAGGKFAVNIPPSSSVDLNIWRSGFQGLFRTFRNQADAKNLRIKLAPDSAVEGRALNADGEPIPGLNVELLHSVVRNGRRHPETSFSEVTNDLGEYRIWGLIAGDYYVKLSGHDTGSAAAGAVPADSDSREAYPTVFYPSAPDLASAQMIHLAPGQTVRAEFRAEPKPSYSIRGRVTGMKPVSTAGMRLLIGDTPVATRVGIDLASGNFTVAGVLPGAYTLQAIAPGNVVAFGETSVAITDHDVTDITVPMSTGVNVQGRIAYVGSSPETRRIVPTIVAEFWDESRIPVSGSQPPVQPKPDGTFVFEDMLPGRYLIQVQGASQYIESIRSGITDVLADGLTVSTSSPAELSVVLHEGAGGIYGTVTGLAKGSLARVAVIRQVGQGAIAEETIAFDGDFSVRGLAPGKYSVYAWPEKRQIEYLNPDALRASGAVATIVTITEGHREKVTVAGLASEE